jgi:hypothetical protein
MRWALVVMFCGFSYSWGVEPDLTTPSACLKTYLLATKANDLETAKKCWVVDDRNASGSLDLVAGSWIASRRLVALTEKKFGSAGVKLLGRWNRPNCTTAAIDTTLERLGNADIRERGELARVAIRWEEGDGDTTPAFLKVGSIVLRKIGTEWKIDANLFTGCDTAEEMFQPTKIWPIWRDEMHVMSELATAIERGTITTIDALQEDLNTRVAALKAKYEK